MRSVRTVLFVVLSFVLVGLVVTGCETGRVNKRHAHFEAVSDIATTPHPNPKYASVSTGIPPVPGSPTAAGPDGTQPLNDNEARSSPGSENGWPMAPRQQPKDRFIRQ
jgi:hypothetical protein